MSAIIAGQSSGRAKRILTVLMFIEDKDVFGLRSDMK